MTYHNAPGNREEPLLQPQLGTVQAVAVALGAMLGAGVYVSMGQAAGLAGGSMVVAVPVGAIVATLNGLCAAELGVHDPRAGGAYQFGRNLVSPIVGFVAGWLFLFASITAGGSYVLTFGAYLSGLFPWVPLRIVGVVLVVMAVGVNVLGVRVSARASLALVSVNLAILLAFVGLGLPAFDPGNLQPFLSNGVVGLLQAGALLFFAYAGFARPVTVAEEIRDPAATLPRAVPTAIALMAALYLGVALASLGAVGPESLGMAQAPLHAAMLAAGTPAGATMVAFGALLAAFTVLLTEVWGMSRLAFAMGRNGDLPAWFARLTAPERIPRNAILSAGLLLLLIASFADLRSLLEASSLSILIYYSVMNISAMRLPPEHRLYPMAIPVAGLALNLVMGLSLPWQTLAIVGATALAGLAFHELRRRMAS